MKSNTSKNDISQLPHFAQIALGYAGIKALAEDPKKRKEQVARAENSLLLMIFLFIVAIVWGLIAQATFRRPLTVAIILTIIYVSLIGVFVGREEWLPFLSILSLTLLLPSMLSIFFKKTFGAVLGVALLSLMAIPFLEKLEVIPPIGLNSLITKRIDQRIIKENYKESDKESEETINQLFSYQLSSDLFPLGKYLKDEGISIKNCRVLASFVGCGIEGRIFMWRKIRGDIQKSGKNESSNKTYIEAWMPVSNESRKLFENITGINILASGFKSYYGLPKYEEMLKEQSEHYNLYKPVFDELLSKAKTKISNLEWKKTGDDYKPEWELSDENPETGKSKIGIKSITLTNHFYFSLTSEMFSKEEALDLLMILVRHQANQIRAGTRERFISDVEATLKEMIAFHFDEKKICNENNKNMEWYYFNPAYGNFKMEALGCSLGSMSLNFGPATFFISNFDDLIKMENEFKKIL